MSPRPPKATKLHFHKKDPQREGRHRRLELVIWANSTQPSEKDGPAGAATNEEPASAEEVPDTPAQMTGPSLAAQNEEFREKVGSLQATISGMSTQISGLIYKLNQIDFATLATIAAEKKAKDDEAAATAAKEEAPAASPSVTPSESLDSARPPASAAAHSETGPAAKPAAPSTSPKATSPGRQLARNPSGAADEPAAKHGRTTGDTES